MPESLKFTKVVAGWYATEDGQFAVIRDGLPRYFTEGDEFDEVRFGDEWDGIYDPFGRLRTESQAGENISYGDTKADAQRELEAWATGTSRNA